jgi:hypothetical protein
MKNDKALESIGIALGLRRVAEEECESGEAIHWSPARQTD